MIHATDYLKFIQKIILAIMSKELLENTFQITNVIFMRYTYILYTHFNTCTALCMLAYILKSFPFVSFMLLFSRLCYKAYEITHFIK